MTKKEFEAMEVKPKSKGYYLVTLYQFNKLEKKHPCYIKDWLKYDGGVWEYDGYSGNCYVCFIHQRDIHQEEGL